MRTPTHCRDCSCELIEGDTLKPNKSYASGYDPRCYECASEHRRKRREAREANMTDAEWEAARERQRQSKKRWTENNRERLNESRRRSKTKARVKPLMILKEGIELAIRLAPEYKDHEFNFRLSQKLDEAYSGAGMDRYRYAPKRRREEFLDEHWDIAVLDAAVNVTDLRYICKHGPLTQQLQSVQTKLAEIPDDIIEEGLSHIPRERSQYVLPPSVQRLADSAPITQRDPSKVTEVLEGKLDDDLRERVTRAGDKAVMDARERGVINQKRLDAIRTEAVSQAHALAEAEQDQRKFGGLQRDLDQHAEEEAEAERKRLEKNRKQRDRRAAKKAEAEKAERRREQKRRSAKKRRAEGRKT